MEFEDLGLRDKKAARTRGQIGLCFADLLAEKGFDNFSVKEVCDNAEIAEATFYNYFPRKVDVLFYMIRRKEIYYQCIAIAENNTSYLLLIKSYILNLLSMVTEQPQCWFEVMAVLMKHECEFPQLTLADKLLTCADFDFIEDMEFDGTLRLLQIYLAKAKEAGELPDEFDVEHGVLALDCLICGAPMAFRKGHMHELKDFVSKSFNGICQIGKVNNV